MDLLKDLKNILDYLNNNDINLISNSELEVLCCLENFWCHNFYLGFMSKYDITHNSEINEETILDDDSINTSYYNNNKNYNTINTNKLDKSNISIYDSCMNLILMITIKICEIEKCSKLVYKQFIDHISSHCGCFNFILSFFRLYQLSPLIKSISKENYLINNLFEFYKYLYMSCYFLEYMDYEAFEEYFLNEEDENSLLIKICMENEKSNSNLIQNPENLSYCNTNECSFDKEKVLFIQ